MVKAALFTRLRLERNGVVARVILNRPEVRNAFDDLLVEELTRAFRAVAADSETRVVVLSGEGPSFCAGADVAWMRKAGTYSRKENEADARRMARMLRTIDLCPKPVVARVHGHAIGGGVGLIAAVDVAIAGEGTVFSLAEVKLGILPSVISPYVLRAIGPRQARDLFLSGDRFDAAHALRIGLVHRVVASSGLDAACQTKIDSLLSSGPEAVREAKELIEQIAGKNPDQAMLLTVRTIARRRASAEAKEGLTAFLEKRPPAWRATKKGFDPGGG
jgi:methylglutaconyl-CoA hydratase